MDPPMKARMLEKDKKREKERISDINYLPYGRFAVESMKLKKIKN